MGWWAWLLRVVGTLLILMAVEDVFFTVLFPGSGRGILRIPLSRGIWRLFRLAARLYRRRRAHILRYSGPVLVTVNVALWVLLLGLGFAFIAWPALGTAIRASQGPTPSGFATALYYSGYALTTLGTGDVLPKTSLYRILMVVESTVGFATITLIITYALSVYSALTRRNTFALSLHYRSAGTGDAAMLLALLGPDGDFSGSKQDITAVGASLIGVLESHRAYPILRYFHFRQMHNTLPRLFLLSLDSASLLKSALHPETYRTLVDSAAVAELWGGGLHVLDEIASSFLPSGLADSMPREEQEWRTRYRRALALLSAEGIETAPNPAEGMDRYVELRRAWDARVRAMAAYMAYEWSDVDPASSPQPSDR